MYRLFGAALLLALAAFLVAPVTAMAQTALDAGTLTVDLSPIVKTALDYLFAALAALAAWAVGRLIKYLGLESEARHREALQSAIEPALNWARHKLETPLAGRAGIEIKNDLVRLAVQYLVTRLPDATAKLKLSPEALGEIVRARLPS